LLDFLTAISFDFWEGCLGIVDEILQVENKERRKVRELVVYGAMERLKRRRRYLWREKGESKN